jgi:transposase
MFYLDNCQRIWLYTQPTDMRKSFNGLTGIIHGQLNSDAQSGDWFVFVNRRKTHIKVLYFDGSGFCIWFKRLEQGQFNFRPSAEEKKPLNFAGLQLLLAGIEVQKYRQYKRLSRASRAQF